MSFLFKSKFFLPIAIAAVVIMLVSIVAALIPKDDTTSSIDGKEDSSQQEEIDNNGIIADEDLDAAPEQSDDQQYYTDDEAEAEGYTHSADPVSTEGASARTGGRGACADCEENPWVSPCPADSVLPASGSGPCHCKDWLVGTPGHCTDPPTPGLPTTPNATLKRAEPLSPAKVYVLTTNTKVVNVPDGTSTGVTVYNLGTKFDIVEIQEYSNGKKFLLTKDQKSHGSKVGFSFDTMKLYVAPPAITKPTPTGPVIKKLLVFVMENKTYANAKSNMPYTMSLANQTGVVYTNSWSAGEWKSLPNYIALAGGSNFGVTGDNAKPIAGRSIFGLAAANGKTVKSYTEDQKTNCKKHKHNPWTYFSSDAASCKQFNVPFKGNFQHDVAAGTLPKVGFVSPNAINNGHDTNAKKADEFFKTQMQNIMQSPDWKSGKLAVIMTYDEAKLRKQKSKPGQILTTLYHPALNGHGRVVNTYIQHYSITRLWAEIAGVWVNNPSVNVGQLKAPGNGNVINATSMTSQLGLTPDPS